MKSKYIRSYILFQNDERARIFSELIENISSVKLGIYESKFYHRFKKERSIESAYIKSYLNWYQLSELASFCLPIILCFFVFTFHRIIAKRDLDIADTYAIISIINLIKIPIFLVNEGFERLPTYKVGYERINTFLDFLLVKTYKVCENNECPIGEITFDECNFGLYVDAISMLTDQRAKRSKTMYNTRSVSKSKGSKKLV